MSSAHRQIAEAERTAWDHAQRILLAARRAGAARADLDALADHHDEARDRWLRADHRARRDDDRRRDVFDIGDPFATLDSYDPDFDMQTYAPPEDSA
ncbi:hypothetical protein [Aureimonas populi]|uniref:Uncharacterized protein n=1 Tax=Aureimonas populi TaxID=1701758 RepID=A0ABW5CJI0_9HYPH|nr:hypothetical protein [Aureimonas populi]